MSKPGSEGAPEIGDVLKKNDDFFGEIPEKKPEKNQDWRGGHPKTNENPHGEDPSMWNN